MTESAPLLNDTDINEGGQLVDTRQSRRIPKYFKILRTLALILSTLSLVLIITDRIILDKAPFWNTYWQSKVSGKVMKWIIASFIVSIISVIVNIPVLFGIAGDITFTVGTIVSAVQWIESMPFDDCYTRMDWRNKTPIPPHPKCKDWKLTVNIIMGFVAAFVILLAATYVCRLLLRAYEILRTKFWKKTTWSVPTGEITWTISLNVITDGHERSYGLSAGAKSQSKASHGPVHL